MGADVFTYWKHALIFTVHSWTGSKISLLPFLNLQKSYAHKYSICCLKWLPGMFSKFSKHLHSHLFLTIWAIPLFVMMYRAWIKPYNISAACSIRSLWLGLSSSSSSENHQTHHDSILSETITLCVIYHCKS